MPPAEITWWRIAAKLPTPWKSYTNIPASPVSGKEFIVRFSNRVTNGHGPDGHSYGIQFYGTDGTLFVDRGGYTLWPEPTRVGPERVGNSGVIHGKARRNTIPISSTSSTVCVRGKKRTRT